MKKFHITLSYIIATVLMFTVVAPCAYAETGGPAFAENSQELQTPSDESETPVQSTQSTDAGRFSEPTAPGVSQAAENAETTEPSAQPSQPIGAPAPETSAPPVETPMPSAPAPGQTEQPSQTPTPETTSESLPSCETDALPVPGPSASPTETLTQTHQPTTAPESQPQPDANVAPAPSATLIPTTEPPPSEEPLTTPAEIPAPVSQPPVTIEQELPALSDIQKLLETARSDGALAAQILNNGEQQPGYRGALNEVLKLYYTEELPEQLNAFLETIGESAKTLCQKYADADAERQKAPEELGYVPGEIIVMFNDASADPQAIVEQYGCTGYEEIAPARLTGFGDTGVFKIPVSETVESATALFSQNPSVKFAEPNNVVKIEPPVTSGNSDEPDAPDEEGISAFSMLPKNDPEPQWYLDDIKAREAWDIIENAPRTNKRVRVLVIDSGIDITHEDLRKNINASLCFNALEESRPTEGIDSGLHGTNVAGIIGATSNNNIGIAGVAAGANNDVVEVVAARSSTDGKGMQTHAIINAVYWAVDNNVKVIT